jgi:GDP-mannose pyrophosphatase NudK
MSSKIENLSTEILSDNWYTLKKLSYDYIKADGTRLKHNREVYDRGNGAGVLLYNKDKGTVLLVKQFRVPTYVNGNADGMLIEVCAGLLDEADPEACIIREIKEETGYHVPEVKKVFESYMSPGAVTELLYLYVAEYSDNMKLSAGGGKEDEQEDIELLELPFAKAMQMVASGEIRDAKTIILLQYAALNKLV